MARKSSPDPQPPRPTDAELTILRVLWGRGPSSVREVLDAVNAESEEPRAYTTILRFLQIMTEKGLVVREDGERGHVYAPTVPAEKTQKQMVRDL
ncbi:MAG: BlaI/MecI/CopY family transcriptional regulator, partial [Verrucomicrobiaceae bacterium]